MDRKWWTLIAVCVGTFMLLLDVTIVNVALPSIQSSLHSSFSDLQWVIDAYSLMLAALLLTTGSLADRFGRRRLFMIGLVIFSLSSLLSGVATTPLWLNLARGAQGVGGAAMFSTSLALLAAAFQGRERGTAFGIWGAITGVAVAIGPVIGGALTSGISWRWIFLVNVPIGVIGLVVSATRVDESRQPRAGRVDLIGFVTFSGALAALVYALIQGNLKGWSSTEILACLAGAAVLLIAFLVAEVVQGERAMFDLKLFRKPTFTGGAIAAFALSGGLFGMFLYLTLYLQDVLGYSAIETGLRFLVLSGGILLTSWLAGRLTARVPIRFLIAPGLVMVGVGLMLMRGLDAGSGWRHLIPGFIIAGAGTGMINPPLASTAVGVVTPDRAGMASGINSTFRQVGIATGIAGLGSIFAHVVRTQIVSRLDGAPHLNARVVHALASGVAQGSGAKTGVARIPPQARQSAAHAVKASFVTGLNEIFLIGAIVSFVAAALTLVLIRSRDFEASAARSGPPAGGGEPPATQTQDKPHPHAEEAPAMHDDAPAPRQDEAIPASQGEPIAGTPAGTPTGEADGSEFVRSAETVIAAAQQATNDYRRHVDRDIERHREGELSAAEEQARALRAEAMQRSDEYAGPLRGRLDQLTSERDRLVAQLRAQMDSVNHHAGEAEATRAELYRLIGALGSLGSERGDGAGGGDRFGNGNMPRPAEISELDPPTPFTS